MSVPLWVQEIDKDNSSNLPVLLVEGMDDVKIFTHFLRQHAPGWWNRLFIAAAGNKARVRAGVRTHRPNWLGVMDLDEWNPADVAQAAADSPNLEALPRFCIESFFCHPDEIWRALPSPQRARVGDDLSRVADPIFGALEDWVQHGAMWRILSTFEKDTEFPAELKERPITDEAEIQRICLAFKERPAEEVEYLESVATLRGDPELAAYTVLATGHQHSVSGSLSFVFSGSETKDLPHGH